MEESLFLIKPDGVEKIMTGTIIDLIEFYGLEIKQLKKTKLSISEAESLYDEHKGEWHFERNINHVTSGPSIALHIVGDDAISKCRNVVNIVRKMHNTENPKNIAHATSDKLRSKHELKSAGIAYI